MKNNLEILKEVKIELIRFKRKLEEAIVEESKNTKNECISPKLFASCKRSAMDLKNELTKLTQSSKYKWKS